ncbi:MAG: hypothetical protein L6R40_002462 [Gallowayella cf. fulva]|nr:MAG: hypothetical protein L6R40_002462 [Xanthomendoza cf. fulva]
MARDATLHLDSWRSKMYTTPSIILAVALCHHALAAPSELKVEERAVQNNCNRDNLFHSFIDPRHSSSASAFCSTYIRPTLKTTKTTTTTITAANGKRDFSAATAFPPSRLSSACSCILTAAPSPITTATTVVATVTVTNPSTCSVATPIVKNDDFESGTLAPWTLAPYRDYDPQYLTYGVSGPGYAGSKYAVIANDRNADSYVELDLQQSLTVCPGAKYQFAAKFYITDPGDQPSKKKHKRQVKPNKQVYVYAYVDGTFITGNKDSDPAGPPIVWRTLTGTFTPASNKVQLRISFVATDFLGVEWGVDNVVVTSA